SSGQLSSQEFEDAAFALTEPNSVSKPIKTAYGWHIIKLISKKGLPSLEEIKPEIENKVKRDSRSTLINTSMVNNLKKKYKVTENKEVVKYFESILTPDYFNRAWTLPANFEKDKQVFKVQDKVFTYDDFGAHLISQQKMYSGKTLPFSTIVEKELKAYQ